MDQLTGKLSSQLDDEKLMHTVVEAEKDVKKQADIIQEALNNNISSFQPDLMMEQLVKNFTVAKKIYGPKLLKLLTEYNPEYIEQNRKIPEFKKELLKNIVQNTEKLKNNRLVDKEGNITKKGAVFSTISLIKHLDKFMTKETTGEKFSKKKGVYGEKGETHKYKKGERFRDLNIKKSIHNAIKRKHRIIEMQDLVVSERKHKGKITMILALDASASMKGKKIEECKKAGVALAYNALKEKDSIGVITFGSEIKEAVSPTNDFEQILQAINRIQASRQTDFVKLIQKAIELFPYGKETKHLMLITDALPTKGKQPEKETLNFVSHAKTAGITISVIGISLDKEGEEMSKKIVNIGGGTLIITRKIDELGNIMLEEYNRMKN